MSAGNSTGFWRAIEPGALSFYKAAHFASPFAATSPSAAMPKKANKAGRNKDTYFRLAKEQGYRARSAFKLIQLNKQFDFLAQARSLVDLCAAPGGWLQVAAKYMPTGSTIIGIDLAPIKPIRGVITHVEDITTPACRAVLKRDMGKKRADVWVSTRARRATHQSRLF